MKRRPCWCTKTILGKLNSFHTQTLSFVPLNLHRCWPREGKRSIVLIITIVIIIIIIEGYLLMRRTYNFFPFQDQKANLAKLKLMKVYHTQLFRRLHICCTSFGARKSIFKLITQSQWYLLNAFCFCLREAARVETLEVKYRKMMEDNNVEKVRRSFGEFFGDDRGVPAKPP